MAYAFVGATWIQAQTIYFTDSVGDAIWSSNLDASDIRLVVKDGLLEPRGLAIDAAADELYWVDYGTDRIERISLDGTRREQLVTRGVSGTRGIAIDTEMQKMYWTDRSAGKVQRANLDGTRVEDIVTTGLSYPYSINVDSKNGVLYWDDRGTLGIQRANLDGSNVKQIVALNAAVGFTPVGFDIDWDQSKMYFADGGATQRIRRANLDGSNSEIVIPVVSNVRAVAFEAKNRHLYWVEDVDDMDVMRRSTLDGRRVEDVLYAPLFSIRAMAFDYRDFEVGDFNRNGVLDTGDIDMLVANFRESGSYERYDLNNDERIDSLDLDVWVTELRGTWSGDANLDGEFNSGDLVILFAAGEFEDRFVMNSTWATGDFNGDLEFTTNDLVVAFQGGGYERGPRASVQAVPEPSAIMASALGGAAVLLFRRRFPR